MGYQEVIRHVTVPQVQEVIQQVTVPQAQTIQRQVQYNEIAGPMMPGPPTTATTVMPPSAPMPYGVPPQMPMPYAPPVSSYAAPPTSYAAPTSPADVRNG